MKTSVGVSGGHCFFNYLGKLSGFNNRVFFSGRNYSLDNPTGVTLAAEAGDNFNQLLGAPEVDHFHGRKNIFLRTNLKSHQERFISSEREPPAGTFKLKT